MSEPYQEQSVTADCSSDSEFPQFTCNSVCESLAESVYLALRLDGLIEPCKNQRSYELIAKTLLETLPGLMEKDPTTPN